MNITKTREYYMYKSFLIFGLGKHKFKHIVNFNIGYMY